MSNAQPTPPAEMGPERGALRALLRSMTDGVFLVDEAGRVTLWNASLEEMARVAAGAVLGLPWRAAAEALAERAQEPAVARHDLAASAAQVAEQPVVYLTLRRPPGRVLELKFFAVEDAAGSWRGWGGLVRDLSRADQSNVLTTVVHELRTPLAALKGYVTTLLANLGRWDVATAESFLKVIDESADELGGLVENVLDMSRLETGLLQLRHQPVDLAELAQREAAALAGRAARHRFELQLPADFPQPQADRVRLAQVLRNLLHNAWKFSPEGGRIVVAGEAGQAGVTLRVCDQGVGVPPEERERIFDRFYQAGNAQANAASGTGLGLYLSRRIVEAHGGRIWVEPPEDGPGAVFAVYLPLEAAAAGPLAAGALPSPGQEAEAPSGARVLVIEDDRRLARFVRANLEASGYEVLAAYDGEAGLAAAAREQPDLVLLDLNLPLLDGYAVCARVREFSPVPIIVLTGRSDEADLVRALDLGADDYLTKPFGTQALMARVRAVMRRSRYPEELPPRPGLATGELAVDFARREVTLAGRAVRLTPTEYRLLYTLARNAGQTLTHAQLLAKVWGADYDNERAYLWVYISRLRKKIEPDPEQPRYILSETGVGYRLEA